MNNLRRLGCSAIFFLTANIPFLYERYPSPWLCVAACCFLVCNVRPTRVNRRLLRRRYRVCADGCELLICFLISASASVLWLLVRLPLWSQGQGRLWLADAVCVFCVEAVAFWNGILRVYLTSAQIGIKWRLIGVICGFLFPVNVAVLCNIIRLALTECRVENEKLRINEARAKEQCCRTKYPLLLVHGVFFRDSEYLSYWGRIPAQLRMNGAVIYYGNHQSAASVQGSGQELAARIKEICRETGCGKVNIIAHSKGGLDSRYAVSRLDMDQYVASLTTINTPHRGCIFADYLLDHIPFAIQEKLASGYNKALRKLGDEQPDFLAAVSDLTASACRKFNEEVPDKPGVYYQSVGSKLNVPSGGRFPLNFSHRLVRRFDGPNDGLVASDSFWWGEQKTFLTVQGKRGISHGDMIDLNRENIPEFDVREFYVTLVSRLKEQGF